MAEGDLDSVAALALEGFPDHFEGREVFADRLAHAPEACFVAEGGGGAVWGYAVAYPWPSDSAPELNTLLARPPQGDVLYLHDLTLTAKARGQGLTGPIVERLADLAREHGLEVIALVAVNDAVDFWRRHGFEVREAPGLAAKLASYGPDARYMQRRL